MYRRYNVSKNNHHMHTWVQVAPNLLINTLACFGLSAQPHTELTISDEKDRGLIQFTFYIKHILYWGVLKF